MPLSSSMCHSEKVAACKPGRRLSPSLGYLAHTRAGLCDLQPTAPQRGCAAPGRFLYRSPASTLLAACVLGCTFGAAF